jgi:hypothetical protein
MSFSTTGEADNFRQWWVGDPSLLVDDDVAADVKASFQMVSLLKLAKVTEEGVRFLSPHDGSPMLLTPEHSISLQNSIGSDIIMQLDDVIATTSPDHARMKEAMERSVRWLDRCIQAHSRDGSPRYARHCNRRTLWRRRERVVLQSCADLHRVAAGEETSICHGCSRQIIPNSRRWHADQLRVIPKTWLSQSHSAQTCSIACGRQELQ